MNDTTISKKEVIKEFIINYSHLPKQGSDEWKQTRKNYIGGSEVSTLLNKNKNKTIKKLILEKIGLHIFTGNSATLWGNVFEVLIRNFTNSYFKCNILETGSIPYMDAHLSYSPDGIAYVQKEYLDNIIDTSKLNNHDEYIVLFEFKCPHSRIPDGIVPEHYVSQPLLGMNIIDICEVSIFIEAIYRKCKFEDLKYNTNHISFGHYNRTKLIKNPLEYGFMTIVIDNCNESVINIIDRLHMSNTKKIKRVYDISTLYDKDLFDNILKLCINKDLTIEYTYNRSYNNDIFNALPYIRDDYNKACQYESIKKLEATKKKFEDKILGVLPYKLMEVHINPIYKHENFIESNDLIRKSKSIINFINQYSHKNEKELNILIKNEFS